MLMRLLKNLKKSNKNMKQIELHGETYKVGGKVLSIGLDERCFKAVSTSIIFEIDEDKNEFVFAQYGDEDYKFVLPLDYLKKNFYVYNKANKKKLQDECNKSYKEWLDKVNA